MPDRTRDLLVRGIAAAKSNENAEARKYLEWMLRLDPDVDEKKEAWYWLSQVIDDPKDKRNYIEEILANDMWDGRARRALAILDGKLNPNEIVDPDHLRQPAPDAAQMADGKRFTCPKCGGRMTFAPDGQSLLCEFCESRQHISQTRMPAPEGTAADDFFIGMATAKGHQNPITVHAITCQGCGATFILPAQQLTQTCPYCQSAYVLKQVTSTSTIQPSGLIPFKVNAEDAKLALRSWFAAKEFEKRPRVAPGHGIYLPAWSFDMGGQISLTYKVQNNDREWVVHNDFRVIQQQDIIIPATKRLSPALIEVFHRYDTAAIVPYDESYLASWLAENHQVTMSDASLDARQIAIQHEREMIPHSIPVAFRDLSIHSAGMQVESYHLLLFPVWLTRYMIDDQSYAMLINGQTGEVLAEEPKNSSILDRIFG